MITDRIGLHSVLLPKLTAIIRAGSQDNVQHKPIATQINLLSTHTVRDSMVVLGILIRMMMKQKPTRKKTEITTRGDKNSSFGEKHFFSPLDTERCFSIQLTIL